MGTRHLQTVIDKNGIKRIEQYGQWDGYPNSQGIDILKFLRGADIDQYAKNVSKIEQITPSQEKMVDRCKTWQIKYPYMSRDCGSDIHQMILENKVKFVYHHDEKSKNWGCEGFYIIDLQKMTFKSKFYDDESVFDIANLPTDDDYLKAMGITNEN